MVFKVPLHKVNDVRSASPLMLGIRLAPLGLQSGNIAENK